LQLQSQHGRKLGESLLELGVITEDQLLPYLEEEIGFPIARLREGLMDPVAVKLIPQRFAMRKKLLGLFIVHDRLTVAMTEPGLDADR